MADAKADAKPGETEENLNDDNCIGPLPPEEPPRKKIKGNFFT